MAIIHVVAVADNNAIGKGNLLPWNLPEDLKHFREVTMGQTVVVGSNTFRSIQAYAKGQPLPGRDIIVISSTPTSVQKLIDEYGLYSNVKYWTKPLFDLEKDKQDKDYYIIGGSQLYRTYEADRIIMTRIFTSVEDADSFYEQDESKFYLYSLSTDLLVSGTGLSYKFYEYRSRSKYPNPCLFF